MLSLTRQLKNMALDSTKKDSLTLKRVIAPLRGTNRKPKPMSSSIQYAYGDATTLPSKRSRESFQCIICMSDYTQNIPHNTDKCSHSMCRTCVRQYFKNLLEKKLDRYDTAPCPYPGCKEHFVCDNVLYNFYTKSEIKRWWITANIQGHIKNQVRCPMPSCNAVFDADPSLLKKCTFAVCYSCNRGFCITCQKKWHPGEMRFIDDEANMLQTLQKAEKSQWTRCPKCSIIVEKIAGCTTISCSCKTTFCYRCGGLSDDHYCRNHCENFSAEKLRSFRSPMFALPKKQKI